MSKLESDFLRLNCSLPQNVIQVIPFHLIDDFAIFLIFPKWFSKHYTVKVKIGMEKGMETIMMIATA